MKKYLVSILYSGQDLPRQFIINAMNDDDAVRRLYVKEIYGSLREYNLYKDDEDPRFEELDVNYCLESLTSSEDVLVFICDQDFNMIYQNE